MKKQLKFFWHVHHDILLEPLTKPIKNRIKYIKENKPEEEVELRLKLLKPVKGKLPDKFIKALEARVKAGEARVKAWEAYVKTWKAFDKAWEARVKAWEAYDKAGEDPKIIALHKKECPDCPWDGKSIF